MGLHESIEAFLNTNELASSDQIDLYLINLYLHLVVASINMPHRNVLHEKKRKLMFKRWITTGKFISIRQRQKLCVIHYPKGTEIQKKLYKCVQTKLT